MKKVPKHLGVILDGNRRFAKKLMMKPWRGHEWGAKKVEKIIEWCLEYKISELTLYALSIQNFESRPKEELEYLMKLFKKELSSLMKNEKIMNEGVRFNFIGRLNMFDNELQEIMKKLMDKTKENRKLTVNMAMAYGGREEVIDAVKKINERIKSGNLDIDEINEETFEDYLYLKNSPEAIIRTGGEKRTSNFLNYQSSYSEWIFIDITWPEFEKENFEECINEFSRRERRFGK